MMLSASFCPLPDLAVLAPRWQAMEARSDSSFFIGWTWMESWLTSTGAKPELLVVQADGKDVAVSLWGRGAVPRLIGRIPTLTLNQAGSVALDRGFIEYNGLLTAADAPPGVEVATFAAVMERSDWRALHLAGLTPKSQLWSQGSFRRRVKTAMSPAYYVDLNDVRGAGGNYLSLLSANTRSQIKRSYKDYGEDAPVIAVAKMPIEVDDWLTEMQVLNAGRHNDNAWDDAGFCRFARALAIRGLENGEVELLRICSGDAVIGLLLNFVYRGRAMNYQSAFAAPISGKAKPGLMCHAAAVARYADAGLALYSLLAGKDRYKQSLATGQEELEWWTLERFSLRLEAEAILRRVLKRPASA